jgi:hypothetical protein
MSTHAQNYTLEEAIVVDLPNHPTRDYKDILEVFHGGHPAVWNYQVPSAIDMDPAGQYAPSRDIQTRGLTTQAWIDLSGESVLVLVNPNLYADTPGDELRDEAQRILLDWAQDQRRKHGLPGGPTPEENQKGPAE